MLLTYFIFSHMYLRNS